jgi:hypothetical protein
MVPEGQLMAENDPPFALVSFGWARMSWRRAIRYKILLIKPILKI